MPAPNSKRIKQMDQRLQRERDLFITHKRGSEARARQRAVAARVLKLDLDDLGCTGKTARTELILRLGRFIERERIKGVNGHWSYDLNRHIALKQLRDDLVREACFR